MSAQTLEVSQIGSRNGAPSRKGCGGQWSSDYGKQLMSTPPPPTEPFAMFHRALSFSCRLIEPPFYIPKPRLCTRPCKKALFCFFGP